MKIEQGTDLLPLSDELQETLKEPWRFEFPHKTIEAITGNPEKCIRMAQGLNMSSATPAVIQKRIEDAFIQRHNAMVEIAIQRESNPNYQTLKAEFNQSAVAQEVVFIGIVAFTITPILMGNWRINRTDELRTQIGYDTVSLEEAAAAFIGEENREKNTLVHLEMGPGNGEEAEKLRDQSPVADIFREVGLGYALHFDPLTIFESKMKVAETAEKEGVKAFIVEAVREALDKKWFKKTFINGIPGSELVDFDCNDLYDVVKNLPALIDAEPRKIPAHLEFENEFDEFVSPETYEALLRFQGVWSENQIKAKVNIFRRDVIKHRLFEIGTQLNKQKESPELTKELSQELKDLKAEQKDLTQTYKNPLKADLTEDEANLVVALQDHRQQKKAIGQRIKLLIQSKAPREEIRALKAQGEALAKAEKPLMNEVQDLHESLLEPAFPAVPRDLTAEQVAFLANYFEGDFLASLYAASKERPNLNFEASVSPHNFIPAKFVDLDQFIAPESVAFTTGSRSESHQNDVDFKTALAKTLKTLMPGGFSVSDGFQQSYTRVLRFKEITEVLAESEHDLKAMVVVSEKDHKPISVIICRAREDGAYFVDSEYEALARAEGCYLADLEKTNDRPDLKMLNQARKLLLKASIEESDVNIFRGNHTKIETIVKGVIERAAEAMHTNIEGDIPPRESWQWVIEVISDVQTEDLNPREVRKMINSLKTEITALINRTKAAHSRAQVDGAHINFTPRGDMRLFPRLGGAHPRGVKIDTNTSFDPKRFPNALIRTEVFNDRLIEIRTDLEKLRSLGVENPLTMLDLSDCVTNKLLFDMLIELGLGNYTQKTSIDLSREEWPEERIDERINQGGIFLVGGSWFDTYEGQGALFKEKIGPRFLSALEDPNSSFCYLGVCWGYQYMVDLIGEKYCNGLVRTVPGPLEIGPTPIRKITEKAHLLLDDLPTSGTVQMTRSGHVIDLRPENLREATKHFITPVLISDLTKHPAGMVGMNDRFVGIQSHSEINSDASVAAVLNQMKDHTQGLKDTFGIEMSDIKDNFDLVFGPEHPRKRVTQDYSRALFINALNASVKQCLGLHRGV